MNRRQMDAFYALTLAVRRMFHKVSHSVAALHRESPVSVGMRAVLESVIDGGTQTVPQMARVRPVTRQHVQSLVNALLDGGYVEYADNPAHRRSKLVRATRRGEQEFRRLRAVENKALRRISVEESTGDLEAATRVLRGLIATFESPGWQSVIGRAATQSEKDSDDPQA